MKDQVVCRIGEFTIKSGVVVVSDPCYDSIDHARCFCRNNGQLPKVMKGTWNAQVYENDRGRISMLLCSHESYPLSDIPTSAIRYWKRMPWVVAVDSGQAGVFDKKAWRDDETVKGVERLHDEIICADEPWYSICCDRTLSEVGAGVIPWGVVSSSGYGDGSYDAYYLEQDGKVVAIAIDFLMFNDEEESA